MKTSQMIFLGLALFLAVQYSAAHHIPNCGLGAGSDACGCSEFVVKAAKPVRTFKYADPNIIKQAVAMKTTPVSQGCGSLNQAPRYNGPSVDELLRTSGPIAPRFNPIGDLCSACSKTITEVVPAYPGKPICNVCAQKAKACECATADPQSYSNSKKYTSFSSSNTDLNTFDDDCLSFDEQENIYNSQLVQTAPADPVSLSLAYNLARQTSRTVPEASLSFGPRSTPRDGSIRKNVQEFAEEKLLTVDRPVLELKITSKPSIKSVYDQVLAQQEALEQQRLELEAAAEAGQTQDPSLISYSDLGFTPVSSNGNTFVSTVSSSDSVDEDPADDSACGPVGRAIPGYVGGNVIVRNEGTQESDSDYYGEGSYEQCSDEQQDQYGDYSSEEQEPCDQGTGLLARLRASARAQSGCGCGCGR